MRAFLQQAEDILDVAAAGDSDTRDVVIVMDRQGGMRMLDPTGWTLQALSAEFGAKAVYRVEHRNGAVRVEGWDGSQRCLLQRDCGPKKLFNLPGFGGTAHATMLLQPALSA